MKNRLFRKMRIKQAAAVVLAFAMMATTAAKMPMGGHVVQAAESDDEEESEDTAANNATIFKKGLGNVTFWKWENVRPAECSTTRFERFMFIENRTLDNYIGVNVPDGIYFNEGSSKKYPYVELENHFINKSAFPGYLDGVFAANHPGHSLYGRTHHNYDDLIFTTDRSQNFSKKDPMIHPYRDFFFTDDDRDVMFLKKVGEDEYQFVLSKDANDSKCKKYYVYLDYSGYDSDYGGGYGWLEVQPEELGTQSNYIPTWGNRSVMPYPTGGWKWKSDFRMFLEGGMVHGAYVGYGDPQSDYYDCYYSTYRGTEMHFSTIEGDTTVSENQVFNITGGKYVDANGKEKETQGVMIMNGSKLVIDGGIVSVKGKLINNGTIELKNGGTLIVQDGGSISPFCPGHGADKNGCGTIKSTGGDIIIEKGGALYAGMCDDKCNQVPFYMDNSSMILNCGLLVYGTLRMGDGSRLECRNGSKTIGTVYQAKIEATSKDAGNVYSDESAEEHRKKGHYVEYLRQDEESGKPVYYWRDPKYEMKGYDGDYDMLSSYTATIMKNSAPVLNGTEGLYSAWNSIEYGIKKSKSTDSVTILKYNGAYIIDPGATSNRMITEYEGL